MIICLFSLKLKGKNLKVPLKLLGGCSFPGKLLQAITSVSYTHNNFQALIIVRSGILAGSFNFTNVILNYN